MSRRERCAMGLALHVLRSSCFPTRRGDDGRPNQEAPAHDAIGDVSHIEHIARLPDHAAWMIDRRLTSWRLYRARYALYLRAVLRAERGDMSAWTCPQHPGAVVQFDAYDIAGMEWWCSRHRKWHDLTSPRGPVRRASFARPLWLDAPPHKGGR